MSDIAKAPARELACVKARNDLFRQRVARYGRRDEGRENCRPVAGVGAQNLEAVIVDAERKNALAFACRAPCEQAREAKMNVPAGERIKEQMPTLARFQRLRE